MVVKASNKFKKPMGVAPDLPAGPTQENLLAEIKDLLKK
jgi:large conductance mechanosensitive channel